MSSILLLNIVCIESLEISIYLFITEKGQVCINLSIWLIQQMRTFYANSVFFVYQAFKQRSEVVYMN